MKNLFCLILILILTLPKSDAAVKPSNPNMTPEARALLELIQSISGKYTLTGQHNYPSTGDNNSRFFAREVGKTPAVWSSDFGFSKEGDKDSYLSRPDIVKEAIRQHQKGAIINLCWHAVPPTADEPVTFQPPRGTKTEPGKLNTVQGRLTEEQYKELLTPETPLHKRWEAQVDEIAKFLKQLQDAKVPVIWRPYHEMNGDWFWWGGIVGQYGTAEIYKMIFDRCVNYHKLNNLVWVWSVDRPSTPIRKFSNFYPGNDYLDILALDVYGSDFNKAYYDSLMVLSKGKPITLAEVGAPPVKKIMEEQPNWAYWVIWAGMTTPLVPDLKELVKDPKLLSQEDPAYWRIMEPFRKACGLPSLPLKSNLTVDFSGKWIKRENKSSSTGGNMTGGEPPFMMVLDQDGNDVFIKKYAVNEYDEDQITKDKISVTGTEVKSGPINAERIITASFDEPSKTINISTVSKMNFGGRSSESKSREEWTLKSEGKTLEITQTTTGRNGSENKTVNVFEKL